MHVITVLHVPDCAGGRAALEVASTIASVRPDVTVMDVCVESEATGIAEGFRGSPTVLIDGHDIEDVPQAPLGSMG